MKESTCLRILRKWMRGEDAVLRSYKYSILFAPLMNTWYFIRADKNGEDWDWYKPCPDYIRMLITQHYGKYEVKHNEEGYSGLFEEENNEQKESVHNE